MVNTQTRRQYEFYRLTRPKPTHTHTFVQFVNVFAGRVIWVGHILVGTTEPDMGAIKFLVCGVTGDPKPKM